MFDSFLVKIDVILVGKVRFIYVQIENRLCEPVFWI